MVEITWLGHGTYQFRLTTGEVILVDPWIEGNPAYPKEHSIDRVDVILVSHGHFDHIHDVLAAGQEIFAADRGDLRNRALARIEGREEHHRHEQRRHGHGRPDLRHHDARHS